MMVKNTSLCYGPGKLNQAQPTHYMNTCLECEGSVGSKVNLSELCCGSKTAFCLVLYERLLAQMAIPGGIQFV